MFVIRPTLMNGYKVSTMTAQMENKLRSFENKILRKIYGEVHDNELGYWRRRTNAEFREITQILKITDYVKGQRLQ